MRKEERLVGPNELILVTGASGFIGSRVVEQLIGMGFTNLRCLTRHSSDMSLLDPIRAAAPAGASIQVMQGNLLNRADCAAAVKDVAVVFHVAAGKDKSFANSILNTVVTTRNLLDALVSSTTLRRFVNVSAFDVYANWNLRRGARIDESSMLDSKILERFDAPGYAKFKQDEVVLDYAKRYQLPYVMLRPCSVYGPGWDQPPGRVGLATFGFYMHLGGGNRLPLTYVDNCANAIALAGITPGVDGEVFNIVDDDLPTSRQFLRMFKKHGRRFRSVYVPYRVFYLFSMFWEKYSVWSEGQLPPAFNRMKCSYFFKGNKYSNQKLKDKLGWKPVVPFEEASKRFLEYVRSAEGHHA
jgi:nucleoside-diphosphate-sugar epimerase